MSEYGGQTIRIRFRIIADYGTNAEGWYIDDVMYPSNLGVAEDGDFNDGALIVPVLRISPTPFHQALGIRLSALAGQNISLRIHDVSGRVVRTLIDNQSPTPKAQSLMWDGMDSHGVRMPAGIYFVVLETESEEIVEKAILVR
jgi:hypothetical protein